MSKPDLSPRPAKLLIDGDGILYRAGFATEKTKYLVTSTPGNDYFSDDAKSAKAKSAEISGLVWSRKELEPVDKALMLADIILKDIRERYPALEPVVYLSPSVGNFRDYLATRAKYKGNRDSAARPSHYGAIRDHLVAKHSAIEAVGQEADDELGIGMKEFPGSVCVSFDKDLLQVPGVHYNWVTKEEKTVSPKEGALNFWSQVLSGDPVDNVPGIKGIGPVTARKLLDGIKTPTEAWSRVLDAYTEHYGAVGEAYARETASLVWVRRERGKGFSI